MHRPCSAKLCPCSLKIRRWVTCAPIQFSPPPWHGSSPAPFVCGGAQRGISLATGTFTGESRRKPLGGSRSRKCQNISDLMNYNLAKLDSYAESSLASLWKPLGGSHPRRKPSMQSDSAAPIKSGTSLLKAIIKFHLGGLQAMQAKEGDQIGRPDARQTDKARRAFAGKAIRQGRPRARRAVCFGFAAVA